MQFRAHLRTADDAICAMVKSFHIDLQSVICPRDGSDLAAILMDFAFHQRNSFKTTDLGTFVRMVPYPAPKALFQTRGGFHPSIMIGFPYGHMDIINNLPIWRTGFTASHPLVDYKGKKQGLNNIDCFPADSGAPVIAMIDLSVPDVNNNSVGGQPKQFWLLGIHSEGLHSDGSKGLNRRKKVAKRNHGGGSTSNESDASVGDVDEEQEDPPHGLPLGLYIKADILLSIESSDHWGSFEETKVAYDEAF